MKKVVYRPLTESDLKFLDIEKALTSDPPVATIIDGHYYWVTEVEALPEAPMPPAPPTNPVKAFFNFCGIIFWLFVLVFFAPFLIPFIVVGAVLFVLAAILVVLIKIANGQKIG